MLHGSLLRLSSDVYVPAEDSFLLASHVLRRARGRVLDVGTGSGVQAVLAAQQADSVLGVDVNKEALTLAKQNALHNGVHEKCEFRHSNLFSGIKSSEKFDFMVFNPPYLPTSPEELTAGIVDAAWNGGKDGRKVIDPFLEGFGKHLKNGGELLMLHCDLADTQKTLRALHNKGFGVRLLEEREVFPEVLSVISAFKK